MLSDFPALRPGAKYVSVLYKLLGLKCWLQKQETDLG